MTAKPSKNSLSIRLTESVVFLRAPDAVGTRRRTQAYDAAPAVLRGLLTLNLAKPTRIRSIEVELQGKSSTAWPEGVGARRIEVAEENKFFSASTVFFRAGSSPASSSRRTLSVGPGLFLYHDEEVVPDTLQHDEETPRNGPSRERGRSQDQSQNYSERMSRRVSMDHSHFQREPFSHRDDQWLTSPPYTPLPMSPGPEVPARSATLRSDAGDGASQILEESRNALRSELEERLSPLPGPRPHVRPSPHPLPSTGNSSASSLPSSLRDRDASASRRESIDEEAEAYDMDGLARSRAPSRLGGGGGGRSASPDGEREHEHDDGRGRDKNKRFTFTAVSNVIMDAVRDRMRSSSPRMRVAPSRERFTPDRNMSVDRDREHPDSGRGRTLEKGKGKGKETEDGTLRKDRSALGRVAEVLGLEDEDGPKEYGDGWKEFKKGTYTYPISFAIPATSPPSIQCEFGSVTWRLKAFVHRPGAFTTKLSAAREVTLVACPEEDAEDTENIIVERQWDDQLQYFISVSGRTFHIGGTMPVHLTLMPLAKIKVYRISVILEERVDYLSNQRRVSRTDPIRRIVLLSLKKPGDKDAPPILPLDSDDPDALKNSPLYSILNPGDDVSEVASSLMGPGPWAIHHELQLPKSCDEIKFTSKNKKSNVVITHILKIIFRVDRGDDQVLDQKTGRRKMFDIVVQTPIHILSCLCNPEWISLPPYAQDPEDEPSRPHACPCQGKGTAVNIGADDFEPLERPSHSHHTQMASAFWQNPEPLSPRRSTDSGSSGEIYPRVVTHSASPSRPDTLFERNTQFERLIAGQESEVGEAPPPYDQVVR